MHKEGQRWIVGLLLQRLKKGNQTMSDNEYGGTAMAGGADDRHGRCP